jgi:hypothetical protein
VFAIVVSPHLVSSVCAFFVSQNKARQPNTKLPDFPNSLNTVH